MTFDELLADIAANVQWYNNHSILNVQEGVKPSGKAVTLLQLPVTVKRLNGSLYEHKQRIYVFDMGGEAESAWPDGHIYTNEQEKEPAALIVYDAMLAAVAEHPTAESWSPTNRETQLLGKTLNFFAFVDVGGQVVAYWTAALFKDFVTESNPTGYMASLVPVEALR